MAIELHTICQDDARLWQQLKLGNGAALAMIYDIHTDALYNYARRFTQNTALVEDCLQELFAELWEKRKKLSETTSIKAYLFKSMRRKVLRALSRNEKYIHARDTLGLYFHEPEKSYERWLIDTQLTQEQQQKLKKCLDQLAARQKEAIVLKFYENLSHEEIAGIMDISIQSLYNLIHAAIKSLRQSYLTHASHLTTFSAFIFLLQFHLY